MLRIITNSFQDLFYLLFPKYCIACDRNAPAEHHAFCVHCMIDLPFTTHLLAKDNLLALRFKGRQDLQFAGSIFEMYKKSQIATIIHKVKYNGRKEIAFELGKFYGEQLKNLAGEYEWDGIMPVPLHPKRERWRGYNQSMEFAKGIQDALGLPIYDQVLIKHIHTKSQTAQNRRNRLNNVFDSISLSKSEDLKGKHILMVDDVVTTGATLDACMIKLKERYDLKFSIAIIALAKH